MTLEIQHIFNAISEKYDLQRRKLIPCFDDFYGMSIKLTEEISPVKNILDVGAGTGLLNTLYAEKYPQAKIDLVDISSDMLNRASARFKGNKNVKFLLQDFTELELEESKYDLPVSALAIHHLTDEQKEKLYSKIYACLRPGGMFINADQVLGSTEFAEKIYTETWRNMVEGHTELTDEEKISAFERIKLDRMSGLAAQLQWLTKAGFRDAQNFYQYYNFVVFASIK